MKISPSVTSRSLGERLARRGEIQGDLSLALTAVLLVIPFLPKAFRPFETMVGLAVLVLALVFSLRGIRCGRRGGRVAAWLSVAVLSFGMLTSLAIIWIELFGSLAESRP
jgi:hypothetical protein